jgi:hypothetical protein
MMRRTRLEWVQLVAGAGMCIAIGVSAYLSVTRPERMWVLAGCVMVLAVVSAAAGIPRRLAGRRLILRRGGETGLDERGREAAEPAAAPAPRPRALAVAARLMPAAAGRRWLAEAESVLAEVPAGRRGAAVRS